MAGIKISKTEFDLRMKKRLGDKVYMASPPEPSAMPVEAMNSYLTSIGLLLNKIEIENLIEYYGIAMEGGTILVEMGAFVATLQTETGGEDPLYFPMYGPSSPNEGHLALSGTSHIEFAEAYKPFPKHWGVPPNAQMKGHDGIMRELPGGYGKGNAPMAKWVAHHLAADKKSVTTERGIKPYPYGNYSL